MCAWGDRYWGVVVFKHIHIRLKNTIQKTIHLKVIAITFNEKQT